MPNGVKSQHSPELKAQARALALQGVPLTKVSDTVGIPYRTLQFYCAREGWRQQKSDLQATGNQPITLVNTYAQNHRVSLVLLLDTMIRKLPGLPASPSIAKYGQHLDVLRNLISTASRLYGWDKESSPGSTGRQVVDVRIMSSVKAASPSAIVDVEPSQAATAGNQVAKPSATPTPKKHALLGQAADDERGGSPPSEAGVDG